MDKRFLLVVAAIIALANAVVYLTGAAASPRGDCSVTITNPAKGGIVDITAVASGTASLPEGAHLWLLAKPRAGSRWWPQGEAPLTGGEWNLPAQFGLARQAGEEFYLAAVAVASSAHAKLTEWTNRSAEERRRPTAFPEVAAGCPIDIVSVRRSK